MPTPPRTYSAAAAEMKTILFCAAAYAALFSAAAEPEGAAADAEFPPESVAEADGAEDAPRNDPLNAVVKLEVQTSEPDVFRPANGKMVAEDVIELFADSSFWKALAAEWADGILAEGPEDVRTTLSALTDLLRSALRASGPEEFNAVFEDFDWTVLFGDEQVE